MPAAETKADPQNDAETNVVELPKLAPRRRSPRKLLRAGLLIVVPLVALAAAIDIYITGGPMSRPITLMRARPS